MFRIKEYFMFNFIYTMTTKSRLNGRWKEKNINNTKSLSIQEKKKNHRNSQ